MSTQALASRLPILDLTRQYEQLRPQMEEAVLSVMASGTFILGPNVKAFEAEVAEYLGATQAIGVASGTDALYLALKALGIGPGDEVITTAFSYIATSESIERAGATPVFVDLDPSGTFNLNASAIELKLTERTKAILPVHLYGQSARMDVILEVARKHQLYIVEDCAQAFGAEWQGQKVGTLGDLGCYSFFPSKNLGCYGDGGLVTAQDPVLAEKVRVLRQHGSVQKYHHTVEGGANSRLDELQAAILRIKLPHIDNWNRERLANAQRYSQLLSQIPGIRVPHILDEGRHVFHQYTLSVDPQQAGLNRDQLQQKLDAEGIMTMIYYPVPLHRQGIHQHLGYTEGSLPLTEMEARQVLSLPMFPELQEAEIQRVSNAIRQAVEEARQP
ncbi:MAG: DegT/DnrJ/EryC1/StrS family aminotransferase [Candidatus Melainabacteria bacterium]|nr:DegT/DnrJ/EryC1/StrS family aminotransferase [Candidatus Melainabacteria bacterium]